MEGSVSGRRTYSPALEESEWKEMFKDYSVFLIKNDDEIIGNVSYRLKNPDHLHISVLVVRPEFQGKGIGRKVLEQVLSEFQNVKRIDLVTHPENPALGLYESLGFVVEERKDNFYGDGEPRLILALINQ